MRATMAWLACSPILALQRRLSLKVVVRIQPLRTTLPVE